MLKKHPGFSLVLIAAATTAAAQPEVGRPSAYTSERNQRVAEQHLRAELDWRADYLARAARRVDPRQPLAPVDPAAARAPWR